MISTSALLTLALATAGQHCGYGYGYGYGYQNYTYVYPTYVQPAYYYQQPVTYVQPTYQVKTKVVAVEHYNEEYADLAGTYERAERRAEAKLKEKQELEKRFDTLTQAIERLAVGQAPVQAAPQSAQAPAPTPAYPSFQRPIAAPQQAIPPSKGYPLPPAKSPGDYSPAVQPLDYAAPSPPPAQVTSLGGVAQLPSVLNRCVACHTGATSRGGFVMFDAPGQVANLTVADLQLADDAVASGRMPKGGPPLSLAEYREFGSWLRSISGQASDPVASNQVARNPF